MQISKFCSYLITPRSRADAAPTLSNQSRLVGLRDALRNDVGAATAEYAIATMAAVGLAGVLVGILKGNIVQQLLTNLITGALTFGG
ncbi:MAG: DUF4244 domain-containing protein [Microbacteriaceae bacterium]|nr:DUF4244 domain-containing protein [Microbacteriaceae bacterium]